MEKSKKVEAQTVSEVTDKKGTKQELNDYRTQYSKRFLNSDGTQTQEVHIDPIHYLDYNDNKWKEIDNSLVSSTDSSYALENKANSFKVRFGAETGKDLLVLFRQTNHSISFSPVGILNSKGIPEKNTVSYKGIERGIDLKYDVQPNGLKESIVLAEPPKRSVFTFKLEIQNLTYKTEDNHTIGFYDKDTEKKLWTFDKPFMVDAKGQVSTGANFVIRKDGTNQFLDLVVDSEWLNDPARAYPVTIDPSISPNPNPSKDTFVTSISPSSNYGSDVHLFVGQETYGEYHSYVSFLLPGLPSGADISKATLNLYKESTVTGSVSANPVTSSWLESDTTYSHQPYTTTSPTFVGTFSSSTAGYGNIDITGLVKNWYNGTPNYGLKLVPTQSNQATISFASKEASSNKPYLSIDYTVDPLGTENFWTYDKGVNVVNGNLVYSDTDKGIPGRGIPVEIKRTYNSRSTKAGFFGYGWMSNIEEKLVPSAQGPIRYMNDDGSIHFFAQQSDGTYQSPPGLYMKLQKNTDGTYTITETDQTKVNFKSSGLLTGLVDSQGNTVNYAYTWSTTYPSNPKQVVATDASGRNTTINFDEQNARINNISDSAGRITQYAYDGSGNLLSVTEASGTTDAITTTYSYDSNHNLIRANQPNGTQDIYSYDDSDRVKEMAPTNWVKNPSFEMANGTAADSWSTVTRNGSATIQLDTTQKNTGNQSLKISTGAASTDGAVSQTFNVNPGSTYTASVYAKSDGSAIPTLRAVYKDSAGNTLLDNPVSGTVASAWQRLVNTKTAPSGTATVTIELWNNFADTAFGSLWFDDSQLEQANSASDYRGSHNYIYDSANLTSKVYDPKTRLSVYTYNGNGNVTTFTDAKGTQTTYTWDNLNNLLNKSISGSTEKYLYDQNGNLVNEEDPDGNTKVYTYDQNNRLLSSSKPYRVSNNLVSNAGFELGSTGPSDWTTWTASGSPVYTWDNSVAYSGGESIKISNSSAGDGEYYQTVSLTPGTYTVSVYVKTEGIPTSDVGAYIFAVGQNGSTEVQPRVYSNGIKGTSDWQRISLIISVASGANSLGIYGRLASSAGNVWFDNFQVESGDKLGPFNGVENSSVEVGSTGPTNWTTWSKTGNPVFGWNSSAAKFGSNSLQITNSSSGDEGIWYQNVKPVRSDRSYTFSTYLKTSIPAGAGPGAYISINLYDTSGKGWSYSLPTYYTGTSDWQLINMDVKIPSGITVDHMEIDLRLSGVGTAWFDGIQVQEGSVLEKNQYDNSDNLVNDSDQKLQTAAYTYFTGGNIKTETPSLGVASNYLTNPGFETGDLTGWIQRFTDGSHQVVAGGYEGNYAAKISFATVNSGYYYSASRFPVSPGENVTLSVYAKLSGISGSGIALRIIYYDASGNYLGDSWSPMYKGTIDWDRYFVTGVSPVKAAQVQASLEYRDSTGTVLFDAAQLEFTPYASAYNKVLNSSFESGNTLPDNWITWAASGSPTFGLDSEAYEGTRSASIIGNSGDGVYYQRVPNIKAGVTYTISGFVKTVGLGSGSNVYMYVDPYNGSQSTGPRVYSDSVNTTDWKRVAFTITAPAGTTSLDVSCRITGTGTAKFDNIRITEGSDITTHAYDSSQNYRTSTSFIDPSDGSTVSMGWTYDAAGNKKSSTDANGNTTNYTYFDNLDRLRTVSVPQTAGGITGYDLKVTYGYDANGNKTSVTNASNDGLVTYNQFTYKYNDLNQIASITDPNNQVTSYTYDASGNKSKITFPNAGNFLDYSYDELDRLTGISYNGSLRYSFGFDTRGNKITITDNSNNSTQSIDYDIANRISAITEQNGNKQKFTYDSDGKKVSSTLSVGSNYYITNFVYDTADHLTSVVDDGGKTSSFYYDEKGNVVTAKFFNNTSYLASFNRLNRLSVVKNFGPSGSLINQYNYAYDKNGNKTSEKDSLSGSTIFYTYDRLNQLLSETLANGDKIQYTYDPRDNRLTKSVTSGGTTTTTNYTYDAANELAAVNGSTYIYDNNGNLLTANGRTYQWDADNRLVKITYSDNTTSTYTYDSQDRRTSANDKGVVTNYYYDGESIRVAYETDGNNNVTKRYTYDGASKVLSMWYNNNTYYYHYDGHGSVRQITDGNGNVVASYSYDAWGNVISFTGTMAKVNTILYSSYRYDWNSGMYYLIARYYDPSIGRFICRDEFKGVEMDPQSLNDYVYCTNNPVNMLDPDGNWLFLVGALISTAVYHFTTPESERTAGGYAAAALIGAVGGFGFGAARATVIASRVFKSARLGGKAARFAGTAAHNAWGKAMKWVIPGGKYGKALKGTRGRLKPDYQIGRIKIELKRWNKHGRRAMKRSRKKYGKWTTIPWYYF